MTVFHVKEKMITWDTNEIAETEFQYRLGNPEYEGMAEDKIREDIAMDIYFWDMVYEDTLEALSDIMHEKNNDTYWYAYVTGFGWRGLSGEKYFIAKNGQELIKNVLPDTENTFYVYDCDEGLAINNYHHDSPTGKEWYYIRPITEEEYYENDI